MRKIIFSAICMALILTSCYQYVLVPYPGGSGEAAVDDTAVSYEFLGRGEGTPASPYAPETVGELRGFANLINSGTIAPDAHISLPSGAVYDFSGVAFPGIGSGRETIASGELTDAVPFTGVFEGNGAVIRNLSLSYSGDDTSAAIGFFGVIEDAAISDLVFENASVVSSSKASAVAVGLAVDSSIDGVTVRNSSVTAPQGPAGIVAQFKVYDQDSASEYSVSGNTVSGTTIIATDSYNAAGIIGSYDTRTAPASKAQVTVSNNVVDFTGPAYIEGVNVVSGMFGTVFLQSTLDKFEDNRIIVDSADDIRLNEVEESVSPYYNVQAYVFGNVRKDNAASGDALPTDRNSIVVGGEESTMTFLREPDILDNTNQLSNYIKDGKYDSSTHTGSSNPTNDYGIGWNQFIEQHPDEYKPQTP